MDVSPTKRVRRICVVGVGKLGLCSALVHAKAGFEVTGVDVSRDHVDALNTKTYRSAEPLVNEYLSSVTSFRATTNLADAAAEAETILIFVDTPSGPDEKVYDHRNLSSVLLALGRTNGYMQNNAKLSHKHIAICCTVLPGYIANVARDLVKDLINCTLSYHPSFIAQGNIIQGLIRPDMVLIGEANKEAGDVLEMVSRTVCQNTPHIQRMSPESAEITKLAVNCFITMKISFSNMIGDIADRTPGASKEDILQAVGTDSRVGPKCMQWGYGFGGPCFPRDNRALGHYSKLVGVEPLLTTAVDRYNVLHAEIMAQNLLREKREQYVFEDVAYKSQCPVPIVEHSQKLEVARLVALAGPARVIIRDRQEIIDAIRKEYLYASARFIYQPTDKQ